MYLQNNKANAMMNSPEISKLLTAAVVNTKFCRLLLADPSKALVNGYAGETFHLAAEERERILAIKAHTLAEFAGQLIVKPATRSVRQEVYIHKSQPALVSAGLD